MCKNSINLANKKSIMSSARGATETDFVVDGASSKNCFFQKVDFILGLFKILLVRCAENYT